MIQICRAAFASHCHNKSKLESSLRMLLNSNLNSISIAHCGPQVAAYLLQSYTQIGLTDSQFLGTLLTHINSFDVIPTSQAFQIYKGSFEVLYMSRSRIIGAWITQTLQDTDSHPIQTSTYVLAAPAQQNATTCQP